jgi:hypothetical protein
MKRRFPKVEISDRLDTVRVNGVPFNVKSKEGREAARAALSAAHEAHDSYRADADEAALRTMAEEAAGGLAATQDALMRIMEALAAGSVEPAADESEEKDEDKKVEPETDTSDEEKDEEKMDAAISAKIEILDRARRVAPGVDFKPSEKSRAIMERAIKTRNKDFDPKDRSDEYVRGIFDSLDVKGGSNQRVFDAVSSIRPSENNEVLSIDDVRRAARARANG